jgi:2-oxoglutarate dehydrogenase E1 component
MLACKKREYQSDLEMNLRGLSAKKDLTIITPFMRNEWWLGFEQVADVQMLQKVDTSLLKSWVDSSC